MIMLKSYDEVSKIRQSGRIVGGLLREIRKHVVPGVTTLKLDRIAEEFIRSFDSAVPSFVGYKGFPAALCVSINEEVVHGIPSAKRRIREGDLVGIDVGVFKDGYHADAAISIGVGNISDEVERLLNVTEEALYCGIEQAIIGNRVGDISAAIQRRVEAEEGYSIVRDLVGHGIGQNLHEEPQVPNYGKPGRGEIINEGTVLAIEPMVTLGRHEVITLSDNWTVVTEDGSLAAHFEHSIAVTEDGPVILTN